jgi:shikimate dehydrogenase
MDKYLVVGTPITQSLSPVLHNAVYRELGLPRVLEAVDPDDELGFANLVTGLRDGVYQGLCVTIPYKIESAVAADSLTDLARSIGAANYLKHADEAPLSKKSLNSVRILGDNTDAPGFLSAARREIDFDPKGSKVCICGSGGVSRAVVEVLKQAGAAEVAIVSRSPALNVANAAIQNDATRITHMNYDELFASGQCFDLLVNATPLGMHDNSSPVPESWTHSHIKAVYDTVYRKSGTTPLVEAARLREIPASDGLSMLVEQAIFGMRFWGIEADDDLLRSIMVTSLT